jgi:hypothetical protein
MKTLEKTVVHPEARERYDARKCFGLGNFVLVVGEDEVEAAAVQVDLLAEVPQRHRRALNVPARPAGAPGAIPGGLARLRALPEREVHRVLFAL